MSRQRYSLNNAVCGVCGMGFAMRPVICPECLAPHHGDCWEYNKGCATYACPSRAEQAKQVQVRHGRTAVKLIPVIAIPQPVAPPGPAEPFDSCFIDALLRPIPILLLLGSFALGLSPVSVILAAVAVGLVGIEVCSDFEYRIDLPTDTVRIVRLLFGREIDQWTVFSLGRVRRLEIEDCLVEEQSMKRVVACLKGGERRALTVPFAPGSAFSLTIHDMLKKVEAATSLRVDRTPRRCPVADAMAEAMARHTVPYSRPFM